MWRTALRLLGMVLMIHGVFMLLGSSVGMAFVDDPAARLRLTVAFLVSESIGVTMLVLGWRRPRRTHPRRRRRAEPQPVDTAADNDA